jgi:hypothetical protein
MAGQIPAIRVFIEVSHSVVARLTGGHDGREK